MPWRQTSTRKTEMSSEKPLPPSLVRRSRRLERRSPAYQVEILQWSDGTSTINVLTNGLPSHSVTVEGHLSLGEAFAVLAVEWRMQ